MSTKYLGDKFDIHGGGMDLKFPHHECEIAQNTAHSGNTDSIKYWLHSNMLTLNGEKMSKSTGLYFLPEQMFDGSTELLSQAYSPAVVRFSMMQCHYRSTMDLSDDALKAAGKGYLRLVNAMETLILLSGAEKSSIDVNAIWEKCSSAMNDDFNCPVLVSHLFDVVKLINLVSAGNETLTVDDIESLKKLFNDFVVEILGVKIEVNNSSSEGIEEDLIKLAVDLRSNAKTNKDWGTSDLIRNELGKLGVTIKDSKNGTEWSK